MSEIDRRANLAGKVAAVVGGASGIGEAVTLALAAAGVEIALCDIRADAVAACVQKLQVQGRRAAGVTGDACDVAVLDQLYGEVDRTFGRLDILVNVAGGTLQKPFMSMDAQDF